MIRTFYCQGGGLQNEEGTMKFNQVQAIARDMGIKTFNMKKTDLIRAIQKAEHNIDCYGTERVSTCQEEGCLWRSDCVALNHGATDKERRKKQ
jgi:hypothetical protein